MNIDYHPHRSEGRSFSAWKALMPVLITLTMAFIQCNEPPHESFQKQRMEPETITYNGYSILFYSTPEEQLRYAQEWSSDSQERRAALEVLIQRFPESKSVRAEAELELAYLALGTDHRFADEAACKQALEKYRQIIARYSNLAAVCAKAHWYMGWIHSDLLGQKRIAIEHYQTIAQRYDEARLNLEPPVPWVSLVLPQTKNETPAVYERPTYRWGSIALLEIIRNSTHEEEKWQAFQTLWLDYNDSLATGYALRALLHGPPSLSEKVAGYAQTHLQAKLLSRPLAEDIQTALIALSKVNGNIPNRKQQNAQ